MDNRNIKPKLCEILKHYKIVDNANKFENKV